MSLLDVYAAQAGPVSQPLIQPPSTPGERFSAEFDASMAPDRWFNLGRSRIDEHQKVVDALQAATGQSFANPYAPPTQEEVLRLGNGSAYTEERKQSIRDARNALLRDAGIGQDAIPDPDMVDRQIGEQGEALRRRAGSLVDTGNGLSAFAGGALAPTPENIAGLLIPPSRAVFGATTVARGFLAGVAREAAFQGAAQGALTAASEGLDVLARRQTGTAPTFGEAVGNVAMGVAAGAVLGGAFHAAEIGARSVFNRWRGLKPEEQAALRAEMPARSAAILDGMPDEDRALSAAEVAALPPGWRREYERLREYRTAGPKVLTDEWNGLPRAARESAPLEVRDAMKVLETESIYGEANRLGLPWAMHERYQQAANDPILRGRAMQTEDIRPVETPMTALATILRQEPAAIDVADLQRSVDRVVALPDAEVEPFARQMSPKLFAELDRVTERLREIDGIVAEGKTTAAIDLERLRLQTEAAAAQADVRREITDLRNRLDGMVPETADAPVTPETFNAEPADMARALQAAEFDRMIRTVRESVPAGEGAGPETPQRPKSMQAADGSIAPSPELDAAAQMAIDDRARLKDFKAATARELKALDDDLADASAAAACVGKVAAP